MYRTGTADSSRPSGGANNTSPATGDLDDDTSVFIKMVVVHELAPKLK